MYRYDCCVFITKVINIYVENFCCDTYIKVRIFSYLCIVNQTLRHIEYLVSHHDCVIIPGLGAVLAHHVTARYDADNQRWCAPCRGYSFNSALHQGDGLLVASLARAKNVSHERATIMVSDDISAMIRQLNADGVLSLGRIGDLYMDADHTLTFMPATTDMLTPGSSWMPVLKYNAVPEVETAINESNADNVLTGAVSPWYRRVKVAMWIAVLLCLGVSLSTPIEVDEAAFASLGMVSVTGPQEAKPNFDTNAKVTTVNKTKKSPAYRNNAVKDSPHKISDKANMPENTGRDHIRKSNKTQKSGIKPTVEGEKKSYSTVKAEDIKGSTGALRNESTDHYCLVIASLTSAEDADKFISMESRRNPSLPMHVIEQGGRYRIYAATGATESQALAAARDSRVQRYRGVWVTKR